VAGSARTPTFFAAQANSLIAIYSGAGFLVDWVVAASDRFTLALADATLQ